MPDQGTALNGNLSIEKREDQTGGNLSVAGTVTIIHGGEAKNLSTILSEKAESSHTHSNGDITGLGTAAIANTGTESGNIPVLDINGKLSIAVVPALAITNTFVVGSQLAMLAVTAEIGDIAIRTDVSKTFILVGDDPTLLSAWQEMLTPTDTVTSVNGKTGTITLSATDLNALTDTEHNTKHRYTTTVTGDNIHRNYDVTHNLHSTNIIVHVQKRNGAKWETCFVYTNTESVDTISLQFANVQTDADVYSVTIVA